MIRIKALLIPACFLTMCLITSTVQAQWATIKNGLQPEVKIVEETPQRLVLYNSVLNLQLVLTKVPESDSDIFADREARRGSNPYRIWTTTELFWSKSELAEDGGKKFFTDTFAQTLRPPVHNDVPDTVASEAQEKVTTRVDTTLRATDDPVSRYVEEEQKAPEPDSSLNIVAPVVAQAESTKSAPVRMVALPAPVRPEKTRRSASAAKPDKASQASKTKSERTTPRPNVFRSRPTVPPKPTLREENRKDSLIVATVPAPPPSQPKVEHVPTPAAEPAVPQRIATSPMFLGEIFAGLILLSSFVFILTLPTTRARFLQWRGNDVAAAAIYEKRLVKSPHRVKLYLALAKIYLRMGRTDESAMKIYKTILQLNLATHEREKFNAIVAQQYLAEGRTDSEALEIIESALKNNRNKSLPDRTSQK